MSDLFLDLEDLVDWLPLANALVIDVVVDADLLRVQQGEEILFRVGPERVTLATFEDGKQNSSGRGGFGIAHGSGSQDVFTL
jgi:hypothetical protein